MTVLIFKMEELDDISSASAKAAFVDVSVSARTSESQNEIAKLEHQLGFRRFCLNTEIDSIWTPNPGKKKKKKGDDEAETPASPIPPPTKRHLNLEDSRAFTRLTFPLTDSIQLNKMATPTVLSYDILATEPADEKLFHKVCTESEHIDLITFNFLAGGAPAFKLQPGVVKVAQERGIHFEISIGPGLRTSTNAKQSLIAYARKIVRATKGKNVILSVGALKSSEVRGPYDIMNLGVLFGMNQSQARNAVTKNFDSLLRHSLSRKSGGGVVTLTREIDCSQTTKDQLAALRRIKDSIAAEMRPKKTENRGNDDVDENCPEKNEESETCEKRKASDYKTECDMKKFKVMETLN